MSGKLLTLLLSLPCALWAAEITPTPAAQYYRVYPTGLSIYKVEAARALITPAMAAEARPYSRDPRVQELICLARALDALAYDGFRLVRMRGALLTDGAIDDSAIGRTVYYFNVNNSEARSWLYASRLLQLSKFKDDGVALLALELELCETASDLFLRLRTYFGDEGALYFMPHFARLQGRFYICEPLAPTPNFCNTVQAPSADRINGAEAPEPQKVQRKKFLGLF